MPNTNGKWKLQPRDPATGKWVKVKVRLSPAATAPLTFPSVPRSQQEPIPPPQTLPLNRRG